MESKIDYLTLTLKPESPFRSFADALDVLSDSLLLGDLIKKMTLKKRFAFYDTHMSYEEIELLFSVENFAKQGLCLKISGQGLAYFINYLESYGLTLQKWCQAWRSLCFNGYVTKCTRFDYAMDDICFNGDVPLLTMRKVLKCKWEQEICTKHRNKDIIDGDDMRSRVRTKKVDGREVIGATLYVGSRESEFCTRFYDKIAEQLHEHKELPENCTSWTRCEVELKHSASIGAFNAFCDMSDDDFGEYMRGVINGHCRFINRTDSNISRCPIKRWWREFLQGCTSCFKLPHVKPARSAFARATRGLIQYVPTIYTMFQELGLEGVYSWFESKVNELKSIGRDVYKIELAENIRDDIRDYEHMTAYKYYLYSSDLDFDTLHARIILQKNDYYKHLAGVRYCGDFYQSHKDFMLDKDEPERNDFIQGAFI